jgi:HPt (histidine-containing phosphotransfer) domain-containing protein
VFERFRRVNDADATLLAAAVERGDLAAIAHFAHRIKGACGFIGADGLAAACARLEHAGRMGDAGAIDAHMLGFHNELERLHAHLDAERQP